MGSGFDLDRLADELTPVKPLNPVLAFLMAALLTLAAIAVIGAILGLRSEKLADPMFLIRGGLLLVLAAASLGAVTGMARPAVGTYRTGWRWAIAACAIIPMAAFVTALAGQTPLANRLAPWDGLECLTYSTGTALVIGAALTLWLRRGAPVSLERAGFAIGIAAGSLGTLAYSLHCPHNDIVYFGFWYILAIGIATLTGRLLVPRLIRW